MDVLRSCYSTFFKPYLTSGATYPIRWYFVPEGRPFLPLKDGWVFASENWSPYNEWRIVQGRVDVGEELGGLRPWSDGGDPTITEFDGRFCGTQAEWLGQGQPTPITHDVDCCTHGLPGPCFTNFPDGGPRRIHMRPFFAWTKPPHLIGNLVGAVPGGMVFSGPLDKLCFWTELRFDGALRLWNVQVGKLAKKLRQVFLFYTDPSLGSLATYGAAVEWDGFANLRLPLIGVPAGNPDYWYLPDHVDIYGVRGEL